MSRARILKESTSLSCAISYEPEAASPSVENPSDYNDEVTQDDIDWLHTHIEKEFGPAEERVVAYGPAW